MANITLSNDFIEKTRREVVPHWGELGWVTYKRTYARWIDSEQRSEEWHETVKRVVEGNINLDPRLKAKNVSPEVIGELQHEAEQLYRLIYGLSGAASGRNLWISGTDFQRRNGDALNNCWFVAIRPQAYGNSHIVPFYLKGKQDARMVSMPFSFLFDELMKGGGVGFSVTKENVNQLPKVDRPIELVVVCGHENGDHDSIVDAGAVDRNEYESTPYDGKVETRFKVPDTREGWVEANALVIDSHFKDFVQKGIERVVIDVTNIREKGKRIHGFGGVASGARPLVELLHSVNNLINERVGQRLSSVDATDICNYIGKTVIAGNVRRSAEIALGSPDDHGFITAKQDQEALMDRRWASNNSVIIDSGFNGYDDIAKAVAVNGEPGIVNMDLLKHYGRIVDGYKEDADPDAEGTNPCGEITLANGEPCNLFEVFPSVAQEQGWDLIEAFRLAARFAKRVTFSPYEWEISRNVITKNRRIGVSMSGIQDFVLKNFGGRLITGYDKEGSPEYNEGAKIAFDHLFTSVVKADVEYSDQLGCNYSIKHTTVKPSGTVSKLAGVSEGMHFPYSKFLIQRIRFQDSDPLLPALEKAGYKIEDDVYSENTKVVEFPVKAHSAEEKGFLSAEDAPIQEQFASQAFLQTYWADNSVSCTITFKKNERKLIAPLFRTYRNYTKSTSLLPFAGHGFKQAPKEPIDEKTYLKRKAEITGNVQEIFAQVQDRKGMEIVDQQDCPGGACPIR